MTSTRPPRPGRGPGKRPPRGTTGHTASPHRAGMSYVTLVRWQVVRAPVGLVGSHRFIFTPGRQSQDAGGRDGQWEDRVPVARRGRGSGPGTWLRRCARTDTCPCSSGRGPPGFAAKALARERSAEGWSAAPLRSVGSCAGTLPCTAAARKTRHWLTLVRRLVEPDLVGDAWTPTLRCVTQDQLEDRVEPRADRRTPGVVLTWHVGMASALRNHLPSALPRGLWSTQPTADLAAEDRQAVT
jgi:hypothetical protein